MKQSWYWLGGVVVVAIVFVLAVKGETDFGTDYAEAEATVSKVSDDPTAESMIKPGSLPYAIDRQTDPSGGERESDEFQGTGENSSKIDVAQYHQVRSHIALQVRDDYDQLFRHLEIGPELREALAEFLIEDRMGDASNNQNGGSSLKEDGVRLSQLEEILGADLQSEFLELEKNISSYAQVNTINSKLVQQGLQLSNVEADKLFETLVNVSSNYETEIVEGTPLSAELVLTENADKMRLVIERAAAFLSPQQVQLMTAYNDDLTRRRVHYIEQQKMSVSKGENEQEIFFFPAE